jgi:hypothetical protein
VNKLIRQVVTGTIVLAGMGTIVIGQALESEAFALEEDFRYEIVTNESGQQFLADSYFDRGWIIGNGSYPGFPTQPPQPPNSDDPEYERKQQEYQRKQREYDNYQAYAAIFGWQLNNADELSNNPYLNASFLAGAFYEPDVTISAWAISPIVALENGAELSFDTRQLAYRFGDEPESVYPNRLEVRYNTTGSCRVNDSSSPECEGSSGGTRELNDALTVGDFTYQFLNNNGTPLVINPDLVPDGYPNVWTRFTGRISGLTQPTFGRIGFRYFVPEAGLNQTNASNIGIDNIRYQTPVPTPALLPGLFAIGWKTWRKRKYQAIA